MSERTLVPPDPAIVRRVVRTALEEDDAFRDVTTRALVRPAQQGAGVLVAKSDGVVAGIPITEAVFAELSASIRLEAFVMDASRVRKGDRIASVRGPLGPILSAERVALNLLQRLSGIATLTRRMVEAVEGTEARIVDTRKTTPGLRELERYAVRAGGGRNHRFNLADGILIKDNHLTVARGRGLSIADVVRTVRSEVPHTFRVEIEVTSAEEAGQALEAGAEVILLDNMAPEEMRRVVAFAKGRAVLEASGGVTLDNVRAIAETGVDIISVGALTHSAPALDISLEIGPA